MLNNKSILVEKADLFAIRIANLQRHLFNKKKEFIISKQVFRSGTSIGANLAESQFASSKNDFIAKIHISAKECSETMFWLRLLKNSGFITQKQFESLHFDCDELGKMLSATIKTAKSNIKEKK